MRPGFGTALPSQWTVHGDGVATAESIRHCVCSMRLFLVQWPMPFTSEYDAAQPARADIDAMSGPVVVDFGTNWCGHCQAARPLVADAFEPYPDVRHVRVEDGSGRALGRSFGVKLWPTLVFLRDGQEVARLVRPTDREAIDAALATLAAA